MTDDPLAPRVASGCEYQSEETGVHTVIMISEVTCPTCEFVQSVEMNESG